MLIATRRGTSLAALAVICNVGPALAQTQSLDRRACNDQAAVQALAHAYVLSSALFELPSVQAMLPESLKVFVPAHAALFASSGSSIRCARALSRAFLGQAIAIYDPNAGQRAAEIAAESGVPEFAGDVARQANAKALELFQMAMDLAWLADVLPPMAAGNPEPFDQRPTEIRRLQRVAAMAAAQMASTDGDARAMFNAMVKLMIQLSPRTEQLIINLASALPPE